MFPCDHSDWALYTVKHIYIVGNTQFLQDAQLQIGTRLHIDSDNGCKQRLQSKQELIHIYE
jgi:hypothetical protein